MRLLVILLAWMLRRQLDARGWLDPGHWQRRLLEHAPPEKDAGRGTLRWLLPVYGLLVVLTGLLSWGASGIAGGLWASLLALALLVAGTGMPGWRAPLRAYSAAWRSGDMQAAWHHVSPLLPAEERGRALAPEQLHLSLCGALIQTTFERYFLPLFWYALLGPAGVVLILLALMLRDHYPSTRVRARFEHWVHWLAVPPRWLLSFSFALAGDFSGWLGEPCNRRPRRTDSCGEVLLTAAGSALSSYALDPARFQAHDPDGWPDYGHRSLLAVRHLLNRSLLVWLAVLAILALIGILP